MLTNILKHWMNFIVIGVVIICLSIIYDLLFGNDLTHPIWDKNYNWLPIIIWIASISLIGSVVRVLANNAYMQNLASNLSTENNDLLSKGA